MNFHDRIEEQILSTKNWLRHHTPHFYHYHHHLHDDFAHQMYYMTKILPSDLVEELHLMYLRAHEEFLSEHFTFAKEYKKLEHRMEILQLDISEHCHKKESEFDKKVVSESMAELKKVKDEMMDLADKEKNRYNKFRKDVDNKIHEKVQDFLKNHLKVSN